MDQKRKDCRTNLVALGDAKNFSDKKLKDYCEKQRASLESLLDVFANTFHDCALQLGPKTHIYAAALGWFNELGHRRVIEMIVNKCYFSLLISLKK